MQKRCAPEKSASMYRLGQVVQGLDGRPWRASATRWIRASSSQHEEEDSVPRKRRTAAHQPTKRHHTSSTSPSIKRVVAPRKAKVLEVEQPPTPNSKSKPNSKLKLKPAKVASSKSLRVMEYSELRPREVLADPDTQLAPYVGFMVSHKFDGWRGVWDGFNGRMLTKSGKRTFALPRSWREALPRDVILDGEVYLPDHPATQIAHIARHEESELWEQARYAVFDVPSAGNQPFVERVRLYHEILDRSPSHEFAFPVENTVAQSQAHILKIYDRILASGGEGVVLTHPDSLYETERRASGSTRVKFKGRTDAEAMVLGFNMEGSHAKSIRVRDCETRAEFSIGIGLTNEMRAVPEEFFRKGELVSYSYERMMPTGVPRHARFIRIREPE